MHALIRRMFALIALALVLALAACGGNTPAAAPTAEPTAEGGTSTTLGEIQLVEFGNLQTYTHSSGVFSIEIPENWTLQNNDKPDEIIHVWTDPTRNGGVIVDIFENDTVYTSEQLTDILRTFLENSFGSQTDFTVDEDPTEQSDGSVLLAWSYLAKADNDIDVDLLGNSFIEQRENKVSILTTLVPSEQYEQTKEFTDEIINTYSIDPSATLVTGEGSGSSTGGGASTVAPGAAATGELPAQIVAIGDSVTLGDITLTVTGVEEPKGDSFFTPDEGNKFLIVRTVFENTGSDEEVVSTLLQMSLLDADGTKYEIDILAATLAEQTPDGTIAAGAKLEGGAGFQVPTEASGFTFVFAPLLGGDPVGVALE